MTLNTATLNSQLLNAGIPKIITGTGVLVAPAVTASGTSAAGSAVVINGVTFFIMGTLQGCIDYAEAHVEGATFLAATATQQKQWLVSATRMLARLEQGPPVKWTGTKSFASQTTAFPRDGATCAGTAVADGTTPQAIIEAECELAIALSNNVSIHNSATSGSNIKSAQGGSARVEFFGPSRGGADDVPLGSFAAWQLFGCYTTAGTASTGMAAYGTDGVSSFETLGGGLVPYGYA